MRRIARKMLDHSTDTKIDYIMFLELWGYIGAVAVYWGNLEFARCISSRQDYLIALGFVGISATLTYLLTQRQRTKMQGIFAILIGIEGYTVFIYWESYSLICTIFTSVSLMVVAGSLLLYFGVGKRKNRSIISYFFSKISNSFYLSRLIIACLGSTVCLILPILNSLQVHRIDTADTAETISVLFSEDEYQINKIYGDECRLSTNIERIKPIISEEEWEVFSLDRRQDAVVAIIECEARYLGIPYELSVKFTDDMNYETKGCYLHTDHLICINNEGLRQDGGLVALNTALHEVRHSYQHALCEAYVKLTPEERNLYCFYGVDEWCENINNYIDSEEDYYGYLCQSLEADSRIYAREEGQVYIEEISKLLDVN